MNKMGLGDPDPSNYKSRFSGADEIVDWFNKINQTTGDNETKYYITGGENVLRNHTNRKRNFYRQVVLISSLKKHQRYSFSVRQQTFQQLNDCCRTATRLRNLPVPGDELTIKILK